MQPIDVDVETLCAELHQLARFSDVPAPAVTRVMLSETDLAARKFLIERFAEAELQTRIDGAGNIFARWPGREPELAAVATGSHCDAIPHSGMFDGTVGVLGGLEAIRTLQRAGVKPRRSIELIMFSSEEPTRYGVGCLGSRILSGQLSPAAAGALIDSENRTFDETSQLAHGDGSLADVPLAAGCYHGFVELHIEQGPLLEKAQVPIGIVMAIAAPASLRVTYLGAGGHAGAVLMDERRDALLPAAKLALAVDRIARTLGGTDSVATTGVLDVHPRAINSIPSRTRLEIDIRDIELARRNHMLEAIVLAAQACGDEHRQLTQIERINADPPAVCSPKLVAIIERACEQANLANQKMISRAYHDSLFMAQICPTAMIFIPCRDGVSHRPDEYASPEAIAAGVRVLANTLLIAADE